MRAVLPASVAAVVIAVSCRRSFNSSFFLARKIDWLIFPACLFRFRCVAPQIRQRTGHKRTMLLLEQRILQADAHRKCISVVVSLIDTS